MPYINNSASLPYSSDSVVIRVITLKKELTSSVKVRYVWFEIPLEEDLIFINRDGKLINRKINTLNFELRKKINYWKEEIIGNKDLEYKLNLTEFYSEKLHDSLPNINSIAWDWIPSDNYPTLLEGNSDFGLFIPQLVDQLNEEIYNYNI